MARDLVPSVSVTNLVRQRAAVIERIQQAAELLRDAAAIAEAAHLGMPLITISSDGNRNGRNLANARLGARADGETWEHEAAERAEVDRVIRVGVDAAAWQYLMHESGLRSLMDATARDKWDRAILSGDVPELTESTVRSTFGMLHNSRAEMFERGVIACFKALAWEYRTNLPQKFGRRIVVRYLSNGYGSRSCDGLEDLNRVLHVLDGKPEPDHRSGIRAQLMAAQHRLGESFPRLIASTYMAIKVFRNGNGHVTFSRPDLVDRMNQIIARHYPGALPAPK